MDDTFRELIEVKEELADIACDRKERATILKNLEVDITTYLKKNTETQSQTVDAYKIYLVETQTRKGLNMATLETICAQYFNGDISKGKDLASYIWQNRPKEVKTQVKISKPRKPRKRKN